MIYTLSNEKLKVQFTTLGGALSSIQDSEGLEYLWQGDAAYWSGQAPVCFPICGGLRNNTAVLKDGSPIKLTRHGIVRKKEFDLEYVTDSEICFSIESNEELKQAYPFECKLFINYKLMDNAITTTYKVQNKDTKLMPFSIGGHPGFNCPLQAGEEYSDYLVEFEQEETCTVPTPVTETGLIDMEHRSQRLNKEKILKLSHELFEKDAIIFDELKSRSVKVYHKATGKGVEVEFRQFPYLLLWSSANHGPFVAVEPWSGLSTCSDEDDCFENKRNTLYAKPGEVKELSYSITIL